MRFPKLLLGAAAASVVIGGVFVTGKHKDIADYVSDNANSIYGDVTDPVKDSHAYGVTTGDVQLYKDRDLKEPAGTLGKAQIFERLGYDKDAHRIVINSAEYWIPKRFMTEIFSDQSFVEFYHGDLVQFLFDVRDHSERTADKYAEDDSAYEALLQIGGEQVVDGLVSRYSSTDDRYKPVRYLETIAGLDSSHRHFNLILAEYVGAIDCTEGPLTGVECNEELARDLLVNYASTEEEMAAVADAFYRILTDNSICSGTDLALNGLLALHQKGSVTAGDYILEAEYLLNNGKDDFVCVYQGRLYDERTLKDKIRSKAEEVRQSR